MGQVSSVDMAETITVRSPYDDSVIGEIPAQTADDVATAVASAKAALKSPLPLWKRAAILDRAAQLLTERRDQFATIIAKEAAKPIKTARAEAERRRHVPVRRRRGAQAVGEMIPLDAIAAGEGKLGFTLRVPIGVVGAIAPFNFPLNLVAHKLAPAIAAGCPVVLKPASQTPFSSIELAKLLIDECGLPADYLHVVTGSGSTVGNAIVDHPDIALITFTGSPDVGWGIRARARASASASSSATTRRSSSSPTATGRRPRPRSRWPASATPGRAASRRSASTSTARSPTTSLRRLVDHVNSLVVGDPLDEATDVSALISRHETDRVASWVAEAESAGAKVLTGGSLNDQGVLRPTVISNAKPDMKVCSKEVFGPVVAIATYDSLDDALELANDSSFGLQAAIFTSDIGKALRPCMPSTTEACWSTRCRPGGPTSSHTVASATAATPEKARRTRSRR